MSGLAIVPIVEGHGELEAVPVLLRRLFVEHGVYDVHIAKPVRAPRYQIVRPGELERRIDLARHRDGCAAILILLDADNDCSASLGPELLQRATKHASDLSISVVLAVIEFEAWFIAGVESLRGRHGIRADMIAPDNPEEIHDAKGWLTRNMEGERSYREVIDQPAMANEFDIELTRMRSRSFRKLLKEVSSLVDVLGRLDP